MNKISILMVSAMLIWGCQSNTANSEHHDESHQDTAKTAIAIHDEHQEAISLNDGNRWLVNAEMKPFVTAGQNLVETYISKKDSDYKKLAEDLAKQNEQLVKSCTMKGKSHDELHKWLHPHLELVKSLAAATDSDKVLNIVNQIKASYQTYALYFE